MKISFIVPTYRATDLTDNCLASLRKYHKDNEVIVVDDGSNIEIQKALKPICEKHGAVLLTSMWNNGFSHTVNRGIETSTGDVAVLVNNDIVFTQRIDQEINDVMGRDPKIGVMGFLLYLPDGKIQHGGHKRMGKTNNFTHYEHYFEKDKGRVANNNWYNIGVTGALMAIRKSMTSEIGIFKSGYALAYEDVEFCLRVWHTGWRIWYSSNVSAIHHEGYTRGANQEQKVKANCWEQEVKSRDQYFKDVVNYDIDKIQEKIKELNKKINGSYYGVIGIKRAGALGDVIMITGIIKRLKELNPLSKIYICTDYSFPFINNPYVDKIYKDKDRFEENCDLIYDLDLAYENRPKAKRLTCYGDIVFGKGKYELEDITPFISDDDSLPNFSEAIKYIVIHPSQSWDSRKLSKDKWEQIVKDLTKDNVVLMLGTHKDIQLPDMPNFYNLTDKYSLPMVRKIISEASCFVGIDSGLFHIALSTNTKAIGIFSCADPKYVTWKDCIVIEPESECKYCLHEQTPPVTSLACQHGTNECINSISAKKVIDTIRGVIKNEA